MVHALLARQLKKVGASQETPPSTPDGWQQLLNRVGQFYAAAEQERYLLERALNVSSAEMEALSGRLAEERDKLTAILRSLGDGVSALDREGRVVLLNPEAERLLGWSEGELFGRQLLPTISPKDFAPTDDGSLLLQELVGAGDAHRDEDALLVRKDGSALAASYVLTPLVHGDELSGAVLVFRDMTERNRAHAAETQLIRSEAARAQALASERRLTSLVQNATDLIVIVDGDGHVRYASPAAEQVWGYAPGALLGTAFGDLVHPGDHTPAGMVLGEAHRQPATTLHAELRLRYADGPWRDCEVTVCNRLDASGVEGIVVTCHDITERKAYEQQLTAPGLSRHAHRPAQPRPVHGPAGARARRGRAARTSRWRCCSWTSTTSKSSTTASATTPATSCWSAVAERLRECVRRGDTVARLGGDEFTRPAGRRRARPTRSPSPSASSSALREPFMLDGREVVVSASIGIALSGRGRDAPASDLLRNADLAMYRAKANGKARYAVVRSEHERARAGAPASWRPTCAARWSATSSACYYQPILVARTPGTVRRSKRWCAGSTRSAGWSRRRSSSRWPRRPG